MKQGRYVVFLVGLLMFAGLAFGQSTTGSLNGTVTQDGAPLPGVTVTISSPGLQGVRVTVTSINGDYNFPSIPPGQYTVKFEMDGMSTVSKTTKVGLGRDERVNATMQLSALAEAITVTAEAPAVLETTEVQSNYDAQLVESLPVARTLQGAAGLAPGVTTNGPGSTFTTPVLVIGGSYAYDSLYLINGAVTNENLRGQTQDVFIEDAIQETSILTGSVSAEFGRFTGGVVSAITKSGGNDFSGSFRDSFSNASWDEPTEFGEPQQESNLLELYEATLGGFVLRDRLWFFGAGRYFEQDLPNFFQNSDVPRPTTVEKDERFELKLTGQVTSKHSIVGSYLDYEVDQTPHCAFGCWDITTMDLDGRQLPREMVTAQYNGVFTSSFLLEAGYSTRDLAFNGSGGNYVTQDRNDAHDLALGTWGYDYNYGGAWGAPIFCGVCDGETRNNEYYNLKGTYYLATKSAGTHNIVSGYENFAESRYANNYQSGSDFGVYVYQLSPEFEADGTLRPIISQGDIIKYYPIPILSQGSDFVTESLFVNDKWVLNSNWSFNIGARYDKNDGKDSSGNPISKDSNFSPRLGAIYDVRGDGRIRLNASYSKYVSRIQEGVGGAGGGGNPWYVLYEYRGDQIGGIGSGLDSFGVLTEMFEWYLAQGGTGASDLIVGAAVPGFNTRFEGDLKSPSVDEYTFGFGVQIGSKGFLRADYIDKEWNDFYVTSTSPNDQVESPLIEGDFLDYVTTTNNDSVIERTHKAIELQSTYRFTERFNAGLNYTYSKTRGNTIGENAGSGPLGDLMLQYPEYKAFAQHQPVGYLPTDQTHKVRLWLGYDLPLGRAGNLNFSVLERFDSGTPYSATANVLVAGFVEDPGYATPPSRVNYFFSDRGEYRWDDITGTDLAVNYELPISRVSVFLQGEVINLFNEQAQINGGTGVTVLRDFNPFTETPVEGVDWVKNATFGQATQASHYQQPLLYRFSAGIRF